MFGRSLPIDLHINEKEPSESKKTLIALLPIGASLFIENEFGSDGTNFLKSTYFGISKNKFLPLQQFVLRKYQ